MNSAHALLSLQVTDQELASLRKANRAVIQEIEAQGGLPELQERTEKARVRELEARLEHARMESELATLKERLGKLEERLYGGAVTNVKELQAVEAEHAAARRQFVSLEQGLGPAMASAQDAAGRHQELKQKLEQAEDAWKTTQVELSSKKDQISQQMSQVGRKRSQAASHIPANDLSFYESLLSRKAGVAVVRVERGVCQGCRVKLPARELAKIRAANGRLISCSTCGRILIP